MIIRLQTYDYHAVPACLNRLTSQRKKVKGAMYVIMSAMPNAPLKQLGALSPDTMYISLHDRLMGTRVLALRGVLCFSVGLLSSA